MSIITRQLISAIKSKNNEKVSELLETMDIDAVQVKENGETALHWACRDKRIHRFNNEALDLLLSKNGIDVNVKGRLGKTPLHTACEHNDNYAISRLLARPEVDVNAQSNCGWTPLHYACWNSHRQIVSELLTNPSIDVNVRDNNGLTPIMHVLRFCQTDVLEIMLADSRVELNENGRGLEGQVMFGSKDKKERCFEIINSERRKREFKRIVQEKTSQDGNIGLHIERIEKMNKELKDGEKKWEENLDGRKRKREDLNEKQTLEMDKYKEKGKMLVKKHKEEETMLENTFLREDEVEQRHVTILKEHRDELVKDLQKITNGPGKDTSTEDRDKLEAAKRSLECPICLEIMHPPKRIWMCRFTHIICELCKDRLHGGKCPTCISEPVALRAFMAENFARTIFNERDSV